MPIGATASTIARAHRTALAGASNEAKKPSPAVSISRPRYRPSIARTVAWWRSAIAFHASSPSSEAREVEPTMSVNSTVARTRSISTRSRSIEVTPTEERVAALVATGSTNREVADALFVSVHTVEANLKRIYRKLGIRSRTELASKFPPDSSGS